MLKKYLLVFLVLITFTGNRLFAQTAYEHISNTDLYSFIDDLASIHLIDVNTAIKPYSRTQIANWLIAADQQRDALSRPQQARLDIFFKRICSGSRKSKNRTLGTGKARR